MEILHMTEEQTRMADLNATIEKKQQHIAILKTLRPNTTTNNQINELQKDIIKLKELQSYFDS